MHTSLCVHSGYYIWACLYPQEYMPYHKPTPCLYYHCILLWTELEAAQEEEEEEAMAMASNSQV